MAAAPDKVVSTASRLPGWMREPLLHFLLIGAALFALDGVLVAQKDDPRHIVVGAAVDAEARQAFQAARGRVPNDAELRALRQVWIDNEVLYREGIAMGLDKGDTAIRERVIFKALSMVDAGTKRPAYDEQTLRSWFEQNRSRYDEPARFTFQEAVLAGNATEDSVRAFVKALNSGASPDQEAGLRVFKDRPRANLAQSYGDEFATEMASLEPGQWHALHGQQVWRAIRLDSKSAALPAQFDALHGIVLQDWTDAMLSKQRSDAVQAMAKRYRIEIPK
jgi:hypothetical protein